MSKKQLSTAEKRRALELMREYERRKAARSNEYFIDKYGQIEDKDNGQGYTKFDLWPEQRRVLQEVEQNRLNIILKARQLGITWLVLWYALHAMMHAIGYTVVALSRRDDDAKELIGRMVFMLEHLPDWIICDDKKAPEGYLELTYTATMHEIVIHRKDGEDSRIIAMPAAKDSGRSFTASLVILDEWAFQQWAVEIWTAAYPTINRPTGGKVIGLSTAKRMTLFEDIWQKADKYGFHKIFLPWSADPRRTQKWYEDAKKALAAGQRYLQEYPSTPEEAFSAGEGTAFPEFSTDIHVCEPFKIPPHWRRWRGVDNGYTDPFAWGWFAASEDGQVFYYREHTRDYEDEKVLYTEQARKVAELSTHKKLIGSEIVEVEEKIDFTVAGLDAWNTHHRDQSGKSLIDYYADGGINDFIKCVTDRRLRKATMHQYLEPYEDKNTGKLTAKLQIFSTCKKAIETLPLLLVDEKDPEKVADCGIDHIFDMLSYSLIAYHTEKSKPLPERESEIQRYKKNIGSNRNMRRLL